MKIPSIKRPAKKLSAEISTNVKCPDVNAGKD
jgi:hypothetical protein